MTGARSQEWATGVKLLSLLLALLLWASLAIERTGETTLLVPVRPEHLPAGLKIAQPPLGRLSVTVSGPRILLFRLQFRELSCPLELSGAAAGAVALAPLEGALRLDRELKVVRISPATIRLTLERDTLQ
jgi:hypothetical protein